MGSEALKVSDADANMGTQRRTSAPRPPHSKTKHLFGIAATATRSRSSRLRFRSLRWYQGVFFHYWQCHRSAFATTTWMPSVKWRSWPAAFRRSRVGSFGEPTAGRPDCSVVFLES